MAIIREVYCQLNDKVYVSRDRPEGGYCHLCDLKENSGCTGRGDTIKICTKLQIYWEEVNPDES